MKKYAAIFFLTFLPFIIFAQDSVDVIDVWKQCPAGDPLPTLTHHFGKITTSIALYSILSLSGIDRIKSGIITSAITFLFETIQFIYFNESLVHSLNDLVLFNYHWAEHLFLDKNYLGGIVVSFSLTGIYLHLVVM